MIKQEMEYQSNFDNNVNFEKVRSAYLKSKFEGKNVPAIREAAPQIIAALIVNILSLTIGFTIGFVRVIIPYLEDKNAEIRATVEQQSWISSVLYLLTPVGYIASGPIAQQLGRRRTLILASLPFCAEWLILYYSQSAMMLMAGLGLLGVTQGLAYGPITMYIAEISKQQLRGILLALVPLALCSGILGESLLADCFDWRKAVLLNFCFPLVGFAALLFLPESPHWLASVGHLKETETSLCWLRGWVDPEYVKSENRYLCRIFAKRGYPAGVNLTDISSEESTIEKLKIYTRRSFWAPFLLSLFILSVKAFGGSIAVQTYTAVIYTRLKSPIEKNLATTITGSIELIACVISLVCAHYLGKRKLTLLSTGVLCAFDFLLASYCQLQRGGDIEEKYFFVSVILINGVAFFAQLGIKAIPHVLISEVFPMETRSMGIGLANTVGTVMISLVNKIFYCLIDNLTIAGTFLSFAVVNLFGCVILYFLLPETQGKSLQEIEKYFVDWRNHQPKKKKPDIPEACSTRYLSTVSTVSCAK